MATPKNPDKPTPPTEPEQDPRDIEREPPGEMEFPGAEPAAPKKKLAGEADQPTLER